MIDRPARTCAADNCENEFKPKNVTQLYCQKRCSQRMAGKRQRARTRGTAAVPVTLDEALEAAHARELELAHRAELRKTTALEARIRRYETVLRNSLESYEPTPLVTPKNRDSGLPEHELILVVGDWHTGQKTRIHETGGVYEQDVATTRDQVFRLWDRVQRLHAIQSAGINFSKLHIICLGDLVEGDDMRPSQHRQIEDVLTVQTIQAFDLFTWLVRQALTTFESVEVDMVGGNHDRVGRNKGNAGLAELDYADTVAWLIGEFTKRLFENEPRVKVTNWNTFFGYKLAADQRVVFEHGSSIKWSAGSYGGVPWYGVSQLPRKYADMLGHADLTLIGHGHRPALLPSGRGWQVINGALPASSNYEQSSFKSVHRPLQTLLSVHSKYGLTGWTPIYLDVPGTVLPGQVWEDPEHYAALANART
jgi:hypothetical protein